MSTLWVFALALLALDAAFIFGAWWNSINHRCPRCTRIHLDPEDGR